LTEAGFFISSERRLALTTGSISRNHGSDYSFVANYDIILEGCDIEAGENVDHIFDLTQELPEKHIGKYDLIVTASTLEISPPPGMPLFAWKDY